MAEKTEKILDIKVNYKDGIEAIAKYRTEIDKLKDAEKDYKKQLKDGSISQQEYNEMMTKSKLETQDYNEKIRVITKQLQLQRKEEQAQLGSLEQLRAQLSQLTTEYDKMSEAQRTAAKGEALKKQINDITDTLKEQEEETKRYQRNVGNYRNAILEAASANVPFINEINNAVSSIKNLNGYLSGLKDELTSIIDGFRSAQTATAGMTTAQKAAATATNLTSAAMKLLKVALISTGIGAIVVALGSLVAWFSKTQKGVEMANKVMGALGATVDVLIDRFSKLGSALVNLFSGNFRQAANDVKSAFNGIADEIADETVQAWKLADALNEIDKKEVMLSMSRAANRAEIENLKKAADDQTLSTEERIKAAERAAAMEKEDLKIQTELAEARLANTLGFTEMNNQVRSLINQIKSGDVTADEVISQLGLSESTIDDLKEFRDQFNGLQELMESSYTRQTEQQNTLNSIRKEASDAAKAASEKALAIKQKELTEVRKAEDELLKLVKDGREKQTQEISLQYDRQIEDLRIRLKTETDLTVNARKAINQQIVSLEEQKKAELQKLSDEQLRLEIEQRQKVIATMLESVKEGSEQEFQLKLQSLIEQRNAELAEEELSREMRMAIEAKYDKQINDLYDQREKDLAEKQAESLRLRMENELMELQQNGASELEVLQEQANQKLELLNSIYQQEGESEESFLNRKLQANQEYTDAKKALADKEVEIEQTKVNALATLSGQISQILELAGENNRDALVLAKTLAIAEVAINQGVSIANAVRSAAQGSKTVWDLVANIATAVTTVVTTIASATKSIKSAKFASGGLVTGPGTGTSDSIPAQLSNGESVMTAKATSMFSPILSYFNQAGGGVPISVSQTGNEALGEEMLARAFSKALVKMPSPVVSVEEINRVSKRVKALENLGNL